MRMPGYRQREAGEEMGAVDGIQGVLLRESVTR